MHRNSSKQRHATIRRRTFYKIKAGLKSIFGDKVLDNTSEEHVAILTRMKHSPTGK